MMIGETLMVAQAQLAPTSDSPRLDAELVLSHVTGYSRSQILMHLRDPLASKEQSAFESLIARRARGEPVAYLTGDKGFWTLNLKVTPAVLVPRPETELLVEWALEHLKQQPTARVADLGTGSGAIALALASECPQTTITATDFSAGALAVAEENAEAMQLTNLRFLQGSWFEPLQGEVFDLIVSNPPYIARDDVHLHALQHEPMMALTDGADGLQAIREIIAGASAYLKPQGWLLLEHGYDQGEAVRKIFTLHGYMNIETRRDLAGHERATGARSHD